jgi:hypothetical protein
MKKLSVLLVSLVMFGFVNAQTNNEEVDLVQSIFGMEKKAVVADFIKLDAMQKEAFWTLYDAYEVARKENGKQRYDLMKQYAENYDKMTNETAAAWTKDVIKLGSATDKLINTYQKKISKATNPVVALQFYQMEAYFLTALRSSILNDIPFVQPKK